MATEIVVTATKRDSSIKPKHLRLDGFIPAVLYSEGNESTTIQVEYQEFRKAYRHTGDSTVLTLEFEGKKIPTLVHDMQYEPVYDAYTHIDFYQVDEKKEVRANISIILEGLAPAVKNLSGILTEPTHGIEISCLPKFLLHDVKVDISGLKKFHDSITVGELDIANNKNITILTPLDSVVASIATPKGGNNDEDETENTEEGSVEGEQGGEEKKEKSE